MAMGQKDRVPKKNGLVQWKARPIHLWSPRVSFLTHLAISFEPCHKTPIVGSKVVNEVVFFAAEKKKKRMSQINPLMHGRGFDGL